MSVTRRAQRELEAFVDSFLTMSALRFTDMADEGKLKNLSSGQLGYAAEELIRIRDEWRLRRRNDELS